MEQTTASVVYFSQTSDSPMVYYTQQSTAAYYTQQAESITADVTIQLTSVIQETVTETSTAETSVAGISVVALTTPPPVASPSSFVPFFGLNSTLQTYAVQSTAPTSPAVFTGAAPPPAKINLYGSIVGILAAVTAMFLM